MSLYSDYDWEEFIENFLDNVPYFKIIETKCRYDGVKYEWVCRGANNTWQESTYKYDTKKQCLENFFESINGFEMKDDK